jgi:hypothetical protein
MVLGWLFVTTVASLYLWNQTGNPFYNLYTSLYGVFSSAPGLSGASFLDSMWAWLGWKLSVWPTKPTGLVILGAAASMPLYFVHTMRRKPADLQLVYLLPVAAVSAPIFLPYVGVDLRMLLIMIRLLTPIVALGLPVLLGFISLHYGGSMKLVAVLLLVISITGFYPFTGAYTGFQGEAEATMRIADEAWALYDEAGGTLVCDYPMMNYRFTYRWRVPAECMISNHYAPQYYGVSEPIEYVKWLATERVSVWVRYGDDAEAVYAAVNKVSSNILVEAYEDSGIRVYLVDPAALNAILG